MRELRKHKFSFWVVLILQRTLKVMVPYCAPCQRHVDWAKGGRMLGVVLSGVVNVVLSLLLGGLIFTILRLANPSIDENPDVPRLVVLGLAVVIAGLLTWRRLKSKPDQPVDSTHTRENEAVELVSFTKRSVCLRIHNDVFARGLLDMNAQASVVLPGTEPPTTRTWPGSIGPGGLGFVLGKRLPKLCQKVTFSKSGSGQKVTRSSDLVAFDGRSSSARAAVQPCIAANSWARAAAYASLVKEGTPNCFRL